MSNFGGCLVLKPTKPPSCLTPLQKLKEKSQSFIQIGLCWLRPAPQRQVLLLRGSFVWLAQQL